MKNRPECTDNTRSADTGRDHDGPGDGSSDWSTVFRELRDRLTNANHPPQTSTGPTEVALAVVAEALAIGETMTGIDESNGGMSDRQRNSPAIYASIDSQSLDRRAQALRSALHSVDDYIWWGGLGHRPETLVRET